MTSVVNQPEDNRITISLDAQVTGLPASPDFGEDPEEVAELFFEMLANALPEPEELSAMAGLDLDELRQSVLEEIESYRYEVPEGSLGRPFPQEKVDRLLTEMREALVQPEWHLVAIDDTPRGPLATPETRWCLLVADSSERARLYFEPSEDEFFLHGMGIWGDAVGCFMAE
jgi:hypothetical protein